jgi:uncharacterized Zn-finger protein
MLQVRVHERTHTGVKPYKCTFCDFRSAQSGNTRVHERRHTGEKPHKCLYPGCAYSSVSSSAITTHMRRTMHPDLNPTVTTLNDHPQPPARVSARTGGRRVQAATPQPEAVTANALPEAKSES